MSDDEGSNDARSVHSIQRAKINARDFDDLNPHNQRTDQLYDDVDDLEKQIDFDEDDQQDEKILNELLFAVQGLGSTKKMDEIFFYMKGPHCEDSLKDIIKFCNKDDDKYPLIKLELAKWEVLQKDLLQLLVSQHQDKRLTFYLLILLVQLTDFPKKGCEKKTEVINYLQNYKLAFTGNSNVIQTINMHLADCLEVAEEERTKIFEQMIELIVTLYKNLLKVPDQVSKDGLMTQKKTLQPQFLLSLHKQDAFDAFIFIVQRASDALMKKLGLNILEIFYHIFSPFEPVWLFQTTEQDKSLIQRAKDKEKRDRMIRMSEMSTRHARFDCNIKIVRSFGGGSKIVHNPFKNNWDDQTIPDSYKMTRRRKRGDNLASIFPNSHDKQLIADSALEEEEMNEGVSFKNIMRDYAVDFVEHVYDKVIESLYEEMYKGSEKVEEDDRIYYFVVMAFGLEVFRHNFYFKKNNRDKVMQNAGQMTPQENDEYSIASVGAALQLTVFDFIQSTILKQVTQEKKSLFSPRLLHAALLSFLQLLYCIKEMKKSTSETTRKSAQILMQKVFTQDNARMLRMGFEHYAPESHDKKLGVSLAEFVGVFFDLLEEHSRGKILKIQTNRRLDKKKLKEQKAKEKRKQIREEARRKKMLKKQQKKKEKERAKLLKMKNKKDKKKKKKKKSQKDLRIPRGEEEEPQLERMEEETDPNRMIEETEHVFRDLDQASNENRRESGDHAQNQLAHVSMTLGTEYTVGSTLQSDLYPTLGNGPTLETMPASIPVTTLEIEEEATFAENNRTEINQNAPFLENTFRDTFREEEVCPPTLEIDAENSIPQTLEIKENSNSSMLRVKDMNRGENQSEDEKHTKQFGETLGEEIITEKVRGGERIEEEVERQEKEENEDEDEDLEEEKEAQETDEDDDDDEDDEDLEQEDEQEEQIEDENLDEEQNERIEEDDDDDDGEDDGQPLFQERIVNFQSELACLANYRVLDILLNMITIDKLESNPQKVNNAVTSFIKKIVNHLKSEWLFFQIDYLLIFQGILNTKNPKVRMDNQGLFDVITVIVRSFFNLLKKNRLLSIESLFRFEDRRSKDAILNNYEEKDEAVVEMNGETADGFDDADAPHERNKSSLWDEKSDLTLMQNFDDYKDFPDCEAQLCLLFHKLNMTEFTTKDIKKRIKFLRLEKGIEKAQEMFDLVYKEALKLTFEQALTQSFRLIDETKFSKDDLISYLVNILEQYIHYKQSFDTMDDDNLQNVDMAIVPIQKKDFDILESPSIDALLTSLNLREPKRGESYWRVPGFLTIYEVEILIGKVKDARPGAKQVEITPGDEIPDFREIYEKNDPMEIVNPTQSIEPTQNIDPTQMIELTQEIRHVSFDVEDQDNHIEIEAEY